VRAVKILRCLLVAVVLLAVSCFIYYSYCSVLSEVYSYESILAKIEASSALAKAYLIEALVSELSYCAFIRGSLKCFFLGFLGAFDIVLMRAVLKKSKRDLYLSLLQALGIAIMYFGVATPLLSVGIATMLLVVGSLVYDSTEKKNEEKSSVKKGITLEYLIIMIAFIIVLLVITWFMTPLPVHKRP